MNTPLQLQDLVGEIAHGYPGAQLELDPLPSGVCFLWVTVGGRHFVIEYEPGRGAGVSENNADTPLFVGHDKAFDSLGDAIQRFRILLAEAAKAEAAGDLVLHDKKSQT